MFPGSPQSLRYLASCFATLASFSTLQAVGRLDSQEPKEQIVSAAQPYSGKSHLESLPSELLKGIEQPFLLKNDKNALKRTSKTLYRILAGLTKEITLKGAIPQDVFLLRNLAFYTHLSTVDTPDFLRTIPFLSQMSALKDLDPKSPLGSVSFPNLSFIVSLSYNKAPLEPGILEALLHLPNLVWLTLSDAKLGPEGIATLARSLFQLPNLTRLYLDHNNIDPEGVTLLAPALSNLTKLQYLFLDYNNLGLQGIITLLQVLPRLLNLEWLNLRDNNLGNAGVTALAQVLPQLAKLRFLTLSFNNLGNEAVTALARVVIQLQWLDLSRNNIRVEGKAILASIKKYQPDLRVDY